MPGSGCPAQGENKRAHKSDQYDAKSIFCLHGSLLSEVFESAFGLFLQRFLFVPFVGQDQRTLQLSFY
jgi:hypothetical protein